MDPSKARRRWRTIYLNKLQKAFSAARIHWPWRASSLIWLREARFVGSFSASIPRRWVNERSRSMSLTASPCFCAHTVLRRADPSVRFFNQSVAPKGRNLGLSVRTLRLALFAYPLLINVEASTEND